MLLKGQPVTIDLIRAFFGTPRVDQLSEGAPAANFEFLRYLVDPGKAEGKRLSFTMAVENDPRLWRIRLRNGVIVISNADSKDATHLDVSRRELAEFVLGLRSFAAGSRVLAEFEAALDRSHLMPKLEPAIAEFEEAHKKAKYVAHGECEH